ncbi:hypothetical protein F4802DRAFT_600521 [Xylaria palmicola]|nr:hypothetical protein F4802DRAFT_600521 [Xylaria palmicola]
MKNINYPTRRLSQAYRRLEELQVEMDQLRDEISRLKATEATNQGSTTPPYSPKPTHTGVKSYARPTVASRCRVKSQPQDYEREEGTSGREEGTSGSEEGTSTPISISGNKYIYRDGVPVLLPMESGHCLGFMKDTKASNQRNQTISQEKYERRIHIDIRRYRRPSLEVEEQICGLRSDWSTPSGWSTPFNENPGLDLEELRLQLPATVDTQPSEPSLEEKTRLNDWLDFGEEIIVRIRSRAGLDFLLRAADITRNAIFDVGRSGVMGWRDSYFYDGPHVVLLGRDEMNRWTDPLDTSRETFNGYKAYEIHDALLNVVHLRNAISHPHSSELGHPETLDRLLQWAQDAVIKLGDEKRALEIRGIRDDLVAEAKTSLRDIQDLYHLAAQPFCEAIEVEWHHERMLLLAQTHYQRGYTKGNCMELVTIANHAERIGIRGKSVS